MEKIFTIPKYEGSGIYAIVNIEKGKVYIGATSSIRTRALLHESQLRNGCHGNKNLSQDIGDKLDFLILCKTNKSISKDELLILEKLYMLYIKKQGFELYNTNPKENMTCEEIVDFVVRKIDSFAKIQKNIRKSFKSKYHKHIWMLKK